jgi:hypothetical protein
MVHIRLSIWDKLAFVIKSLCVGQKAQHIFYGIFEASLSTTRIVNIGRDFAIIAVMHEVSDSTALRQHYPILSSSSLTERWGKSVILSGNMGFSHNMDVTRQFMQENHRENLTGRNSEGLKMAT